MALRVAVGRSSRERGMGVEPTQVDGIPTNLTHRLWFDYVTGNVPGVSKEHTIQWRFKGDYETDLVINEGQIRMLRVLADGFLPGGLRTGWRIIRVRYCHPGENFSFPVEMITGLEAFAGSATTGWTADQEAMEISFQGRSYTTGRRASMSFYGVAVSRDTNFRFTVGEWSRLAPILDELTSDVLIPISAIDGSTPVWYPYANQNSNSYWEKRIRRG